MMLEAVFPVTRDEAEKTGVRFSSEQNKKALFPTRLRELRKEKGVSQQQMADLIHISKSALGYYETGDSLPNAKAVAVMAEFFGVSADYLLGLSDVHSPDPEVRGICERIGLEELAVEDLIERQDGLRSPDGLSEITLSYRRRMFRALNVLIIYHPELLAEIGDYLYFRFRRFERDATSSGEAGSEKYMKAVGDYGDGREQSVEVNGELLADTMLLRIEQGLRSLRAELIRNGVPSTTMRDFWDLD